MVIQRWQSLLLLIATVLIVLVNFMPVAQMLPGQGAPTPMFTTDAPILLVIDIVVGVLLFLNIFMFKNLRLQMRVTLLSILLMCVLTVTGAFIIYRNSPVAQVEWTGAVLLLLVALIFALAAYRFMRRDHNLLRSVDRLR